MKKHSFKERFKYWLDDVMAKGTGSMILLLVIVTLFVTFIISGAIIVFNLNNNIESRFVVWNVIAYTFNKWFPFHTDGPMPYLVPAALASISGILFTSILIGLFSSAIESKLASLKKGNSDVLEDGHIVVLGFQPGEYTLIKQLIVAAGSRQRCIVVADNYEKDEMESLIRSNVDIPKNVKIICRNVDICDPQQLKCCAINDCHTVIASPISGDKIVKAILAVLTITNHNLDKKIKIIAAVEDNKYVFPAYMQEQHNIFMLQTNDMIARFVARSCTQHGIAGVFEIVYCFEGSEFYSDVYPELTGTSFAQLTKSIDSGVPVGIIKDGLTSLNPNFNDVLEENDRLIYFSEERRSINIDNIDRSELKLERKFIDYNIDSKLVIFGYNDTLPTMIFELPENIKEITLAETGSHRFSEDFTCVGKQVHVFKGNINSPKELRDLIKDADQIILIDNHEENADEAIDVDTMMLMLRLRSIKNKYHYKFSITSEFVKESNRRLMLEGDNTDCIVANNMVSMVLAQIVENPELVDLFKELLSDFGSEIYMKTPAMMEIETGDYTVQELRMLLLERKHLLLGYRIDGDDGELIMNPSLHDKLTLQDNSRLAVIAEE